LFIDNLGFLYVVEQIAVNGNKIVK
jgi:hypothetical protein